MLNRKDIVYINHYKDAREIFGNSINIEGGVNYFLIDKFYNGDCNYNNMMINLTLCDIIIEPHFLKLIDKFKDCQKIIDTYCSKGYYEIPLTDIRIHDEKNDTDVICYVSQQKGFKKYIDKNTLKKEKLNTWKIITPTANGGKGCFGNTFIGNPYDVHSESYISFNIKTESEAISLLSYMKCRLPNLLLSLRKISQNISKDTCKWIPLPSLNKEWTDEEVYKYFKLSEEEIKIVKETKIIGYKEI